MIVNDCPVCKGSGMHGKQQTRLKKPSDYRLCDRCRGTGYESRADFLAAVERLNEFFKTHPKAEHVTWPPA